MNRYKPNQRKSRREFTAASKVHPKNIAPAPMRGGYRI